jgi:flagellar biosynthesis protein
MKERKAIAIKYPENSPAPFILASTKNELAVKMIEEAKKQNIPIVEDDILTDILLKEEIGSMIPEQTWNIMANIFSVILNVKKDK